MQIKVIEHAGFCFGVSRAVELLEKEIESDSFSLYTLGPIIHNPQIIQQMGERGVRIAEDINQRTAR